MAAHRTHPAPPRWAHHPRCLQSPAGNAGARRRRHSHQYSRPTPPWRRRFHTVRRCHWPAASRPPRCRCATTPRPRTNSSRPCAAIRPGGDPVDVGGEVDRVQALQRVFPRTSGRDRQRRTSRDIDDPPASPLTIRRELLVHQHIAVTRERIDVRGGRQLGCTCQPRDRDRPRHPNTRRSEQHDRKDTTDNAPREATPRPTDHAHATPRPRADPRTPPRPSHEARVSTTSAHPAQRDKTTIPRLILREQHAGHGWASPTPTAEITPGRLLAIRPMVQAPGSGTLTASSSIAAAGAMARATL